MLNRPHVWGDVPFYEDMLTIRRLYQREVQKLAPGLDPRLLQVEVVALLNRMPMSLGMSPDVIQNIIQTAAVFARVKAEGGVIRANHTSGLESGG